ncbi:hypothetical protein YC2023_083709 [Brassica napus]
MGTSSAPITPELGVQRRPTRESSLLRTWFAFLTVPLLPWILWNLWYARNLLLFESRSVPATSVVSNAVLGAREWELAQGDLRGTVASTTRAELQLPIPSDCSIVNCDASWLSESFSAGLGWLIEEKQSGVTTEFQARAEYVASPLMAEALALREALTTVRQHRSSNVWIRSDNLELIRAINSKAFPMELFGVLKDIEFLSQFFDFICFTHVSRSYNGRVDSLAKSAHHLASPALY